MYFMLHAHLMFRRAERRVWAFAWSPRQIGLYALRPPPRPTTTEIAALRRSGSQHVGANLVRDHVRKKSRWMPWYGGCGVLAGWYVTSCLLRRCSARGFARITNLSPTCPQAAYGVLPTSFYR